jgi:hypothetical protein
MSPVARPDDTGTAEAPALRDGLPSDEEVSRTDDTGQEVDAPQPEPAVTDRIGAVAAAMALANRTDSEAAEAGARAETIPDIGSIAAFFAQGDRDWSDDTADGAPDSPSDPDATSVASRLARIRQAERLEADLDGWDAASDTEEPAPESPEDDAAAPSVAREKTDGTETGAGRQIDARKGVAAEASGDSAELEAPEPTAPDARDAQRDAPSADAVADTSNDGQSPLSSDTTRGMAPGETENTGFADEAERRPDQEADAGAQRAAPPVNERPDDTELDGSAAERRDWQDPPPSARATIAPPPRPDAASTGQFGLGAGTGPNDRGDMNRLFDATDTRMANAETSRRRANIQHLKAAVAARVAERRLVEAGVQPGEANVDATAKYRDDLKRVMRPTRVRVDVSRRRESRQPPLVLVSEQRVDRAPTDGSEPAARAAGKAEAFPAGAGRPPEKISRSLADLAQRAGGVPGSGGRAGPATAAALSATPEDIVSNDPMAHAPDAAMPEGAADLPDFVMRFAEVLEDSDATEIEEVVEMGAAFITRDLGQPDFKRVQLIRLVRMATAESISRDTVLATIEQLVQRNVLSQSPNGRYRLQSKGA